jgi:hypothetical protein
MSPRLRDLYSHIPTSHRFRCEAMHMVMPLKYSPYARSWTFNNDPPLPTRRSVSPRKTKEKAPLNVLA